MSCTFIEYTVDVILNSTISYVFFKCIIIFIFPLLLFLYLQLCLQISRIG